MNKTIMKKMGFGREVALKENGLCPFCRCSVDTQTFRDELNIKEFAISGLCQDCQDKTFID
jgi:hypothetical protein